MKTAREILLEEWDCEDMDLQTRIILNADVDKIVSAVNTARKEIIEECAKRARTRTNDESTSVIVDKQSILSLINELK